MVLGVASAMHIMQTEIPINNLKPGKKEAVIQCIMLTQNLTNEA